MSGERGAMFDEFVSGGGFGEGEGTIITARFNQWDYRGKVNPPVLALRLNMKDAQGGDHEEQLSSGELRFFVPSGDGKKAVPVTEGSKLNLNTNAVALILSICNADTRGELAKKIKSTDDISVLDGLKAYFITKEIKRAGLIPQPGQENKAQTQLLCQRIIAYPWETGAAAPATAAAPAAPAAAPAAPVASAPAAPAPAAAPAGDLAGAAATLLNIVLSNGGSIKKTMIAGKVFSSDEGKAMVPAARNALLGLVVQDTFLGSAEVAAMGMAYDPATGTVSMAG